MIKPPNMMSTIPNTDPTMQATILHAATLLKQGEMVVIPTETVYGLAADANQPEAVKKIFALKGRPENHPLIVHIEKAEHLAYWATEIPKATWQLAEKFWPGPLTMILPKAKHVALEVTGGQNTIALRIPQHPLTLELLHQLGKKAGLTAPSANRFGQLSPTRAEHVLHAFGDQCPLVLDAGECNLGIESTIIDLTVKPYRVLRPGMITAQMLSACLAEPVQYHQLSTQHTYNAPRVPGSLAQHYAPLTPLRIFSRAELQKEILKISTQKSVTQLAVVYFSPELRNQLQDVMAITAVCLPNQPQAYAAQLYQTLHQLDLANYQEIWLEEVPDEEFWYGISDRLNKASRN